MKFEAKTAGDCKLSEAKSSTGLQANTTGLLFAQPLVSGWSGIHMEANYLLNKNHLVLELHIAVYTCCVTIAYLLHLLVVLFLLHNIFVI
jgi:hypothetical protein